MRVAAKGVVASKGVVGAKGAAAEGVPSDMKEFETAYIGRINVFFCKI